MSEREEIVAQARDRVLAHCSRPFERVRKARLKLNRAERLLAKAARGGKAELSVKERTVKKARAELRDAKARRGRRSDSQLVGWGNPTIQRVRFQILSEIGDLQGRSVLDVGSGFGDLHTFLTDQCDISIGRYLGLDITPDIISMARERHPDLEFRQEDLLLSPIGKEEFDYVFISGTLSWRWDVYTRDILIAAFRACRVGLAVNFVFEVPTPEVVEISKGLHQEYVTPSLVLSFLHKKLSHCVVCRRDYAFADFSFYVYRDCSEYHYSRPALALPFYYQRESFE